MTVEQSPPMFADRNPSPAEAAEALRAERILDVRSVSTARAKLIARLEDAATLDALKPDFPRLYELCEEYDLTGFYPFAPADTPRHDIRARQFPHHTGLPEDPATGVAAGALAAYLAQDRASGRHEVRIGQGHAVGRSSMITGATLVEDDAITRVRLTGRAEITAGPTTP